MILRLSKISLLLAVALFFSIVAFTNMTDYESNAQFVRHVLAMDTTFPGNRAMYRALPQHWVHTVFYCTIIAWETATAILGWAGGLQLLRQLKSPAAAFVRAKSIGIAALTLGCLLWFVAFLTIGGEWFLMWQSHTWNGQDAAFRMFAILGIILLYLTAPEPAIL
jgi:predicted small integral membrane protein